MRIAISTGGGDAPGLNAVIKAVVYGGTERDFEVIGIRKGWEGLTHVNLDDPESHAHYVKTLTREESDAMVDRMRRRVIELSHGTLARDQARGVYGVGN